MANFLGAIGDILSGGNQSKAAGASQAGVDALKNLSVPELRQDPLVLQQLVEQGVISPEDAQVFLMQDTAMGGISTDPKLQQAQYDALASLQNVADEGGLTAADRANLARIQSDEQTASRGAREAIINNMQARGLGGSGMELLAQMQNQQDAATRQSQRDLDVAGLAQARALQAMTQAGSLGGQMQQQSFDQQAKVAAARDAINQFNTQNQQQVSNLNTQARNAAQAQNLQNKQNIANTNVDIANQQSQFNNQLAKNLAQQNFDNQYKKAGGTAQAYQQQAQQYNQAGKQITDLVGSGIQGGAAAYAASDEKLKEDFDDFDAREFLDSLTDTKTYRYKDEDKYGKGRHAGPMAQDLERTEVGRSLVENTPEGKMVNYGKGFGTLLASLTDVHKRVKDLEDK